MLKDFLQKFIYTNESTRSTKTYLYQYNDEQFRLVKMKVKTQDPGFEKIKEKGWFDTYEQEREKDTKTDKNSREIQRISLSRTKRNIRELALCNDFEWFGTLTIKTDRTEGTSTCDRYSLDEVQNKLKKLLRRVRDRNAYHGKGLRYLIITEKHKDGAFHFHGLFSGLDDLYINDYGYLSSKTFDEMGFNSFSKINDYAKCCNYITKYITKDCVKNSHNQIYISSRGLKKATRFTIDDNPNFFYDYENDYCQIKDFNVSEMSQEFLLDIIRVL